jgi:hypothetical protein
LGTVLLLLVLAGWIGVGFWWFTTHRGTPADATGSFKAQLGTLERRSPGLVSPAHRLSAGRSAHVPRPRPMPRSTAQQRALVARRRRDVLSGLALATGATFALGVIPTLRVLWIASVVFAAMLAAYVYILVQLRDMNAGHSSEPRAVRRREPAMAPVARERAERPRRQNDTYGYVYEAEPALVRRIAN